jgi:hypothetical protein
MTGDPEAPGELEAELGALYRGPLEGFVGRRDALAKKLRASKRRDDAERAKALRKPSRTAWALDQVVFEDPAPVEQLAAAISAAQEAPSGTGAARAAVEGVRSAVRAVADAGARASVRAGHALEAAALVAAVRAVIGDADAFAALRAGRLVEIPEGGGLDLLTAMGAGTPLPPPAAAPDATSDAGRDEEASSRRGELIRAEALLAGARERAHAAERAVVNAEARLGAAEEQLARARESVEARRAELARAKSEAKLSLAEVAEAERAAAGARARVEADS